MTNTSMLNSQPDNISLLENNKYRFIIPNLPFANYFLQSVNLPGVSTNFAEVPTPFHVQKRHGDRLNYEDLQMQVIIDEDLRIWEETFNWLSNLTTPEGFHQYDQSNKLKSGQKYNEGILEFNKNSNLSNLRIRFHNCHIMSIGPIQMSHAVNEPEHPICDMVVAYDTFTIERL
jgi:hypothetical protein